MLIEAGGVPTAPPSGRGRSALQLFLQAGADLEHMQVTSERTPPELRAATAVRRPEPQPETTRDAPVPRAATSLARAGAICATKKRIPDPPLELADHGATQDPPPTIQRLSSLAAVQRGLFDAIAGAASGLRDRALGSLAAQAEQIPGYSLLSAVLGRNVLTGAEVPRTPVTLVSGLAGLIPGGRAALQLQRAGVLQRASDWTTGSCQGSDSHGRRSEDCSHTCGTRSDRRTCLTPRVCGIGSSLSSPHRFQHASARSP